LRYSRTFPIPNPYLPFLPFFLPLLPLAYGKQIEQLPSNGKKIWKRQPSAAAIFSLGILGVLAVQGFALPPFSQITFLAAAAILAFESSCV